MPFRQHLQGLFDKAEHAIVDHNKSGSTSTSGPPPIPTASKPNHSPFATSAPQLYWTPNLAPSTPVTDNFYHETGQHGWGNNEAQNYVAHPSNSYHSNNNSLILAARINSALPSNDQKYTSARLSSHQTLSRPRGRLSAHITAPSATGIWPAFWLLPHDPFTWPTDGEVDIFEAWDGDLINHSCLHWGFFDGNDWDKHRVLESQLPRLTNGGHKFDFVWDENEGTGEGRLVWYIDSRPVMRANKPKGTRKMRDFRILINIAVGGNVCKGHMPRDGRYEMEVKELGMWDAPERGWEGFVRDWNEAKEGHPV